jgi:hypothetical protein
MPNLMEEFALFEHANLTKGHAYAAFYNFRRGGRWDRDAWLQVLMTLLEFRYFRTHYRRLKGGRDAHHRR